MVLFSVYNDSLGKALRMRLTRSQWYILSLSILTVILGVATNLATDQLPNWLMPYTWLSWPLLGVFTVFFVVLSLCQPSQGASTQHSNIDKQRNPDKKTRHGRIPQSDWVAIPFPPIIDRDTFEAAQAQMRENFRHSRRNRQHDYLFLGGRLRCGQCGCAMTGQVWT